MFVQIYIFEISTYILNKMKKKSDHMADATGARHYIRHVVIAVLERKEGGENRGRWRYERFSVGAQARSYEDVLTSRTHVKTNHANE